MTEILDRINTPGDVRKLDRKQLPQLAAEIRERIIDVVSKIGGHFGGNLGIVELTLALHYVYDTPRDQVVFDTGHQSYPHKLITGRRETFPTVRQHGGISGFCKREESEYDVFNAGHASTSISAALGIAVARDFRKEDYRVIAVIGDGALSGGLALEGLNHAGHLKRKLLIVLNDNDMSISTNVGAMSGYLNSIIKGQRYNLAKDLAKGVMDRIPLIGGKLHGLAHDMEQVLKQMVVPGTLFEELGFKYLGPYDGHDLHGNARDETDRRDLLDVPAARVRSGFPRRDDHGSAGGLRARPRRHRRPGRPDAPRHLRHGVPADLPEHDLHGAEG